MARIPHARRDCGPPKSCGHRARQVEALHYRLCQSGREHLPPHLVGNIEKDCAFLDADKNFTKPQPKDYSSLLQAHSVFGLVEKFTGATMRQSGRAATLLKGVLTSGVLCEFDKLTATLECFNENLADLPSSFGGTSGGGLWRVYVRKREEGSFEAVHHRLIGIASRENVACTPPRIRCQGIGRIEALLEGSAAA